MLSLSIEETINFFDNECTVGELIWASSVFNDLIAKTQSKKLLLAMYRLVEKFQYSPEMAKYNIVENMVFTDQALED